MFLTLGQLSCSRSRDRSKGPLIVASAGKIISLDPAQASTFDALQLLSALGDPLYRLDRNGNLEPRLAEGLPQISEDKLSILIPLRKQILFHDGTPFNAESMVFSIKRFMRIGTLNYVLGDKISSVEAVDKHLLKFNLKRPSTSLNGLLTSISLTPVSPTAYKGFESNFLNNKFVGTGPYKLKSFHEQQQRLVPFDSYWGDQARNRGIDFIKLTNSISLFGAIKTGEIDVLISNAIDADHRLALSNMSKDRKLIEGVGPALEVGYITFLTNTPPLDKLTLRKALSMSLDRNLITQRVSYGQRTPLRSLIPPTLSRGKDTFWPEYSPNTARKIFQQSGYCSGERLKLPLTFRSNVPADKLLALTWKAQIEKDLSDCLVLLLDGVEATTVYRQLGKGAFQVVMLDWRGAYPDPEAYLAPLLSCTKSKGFVCLDGEAVVSGSFWTSPGLEQLLLSSDQLFGEDRFDQLREIEQIAADGLPYVPVWLVKPKVWLQPYLEPPVFDGSGHLMLQLLSPQTND